MPDETTDPRGEPADQAPGPPATEAGKEDSGARDEERTEQAMANTDEPAAADQARAHADTAAAEPSDAEAPPPPLSETEQELLDGLERELGDAVVEHASAFGTLVVRVRPDAWRQAAEVTKHALDCDYLSFVSGIDWQPAPREGGEVGGESSAPVQPTEMTFGAAGSEGRFQVFAHVESTTRRRGCTLKTDVEETAPRAQSWVSVYSGADWHERECWEMFGIVFEGHPSLRHLYLPSEFEGHPLRKDFPLLARQVKPWPGLVDVEAMPGEEQSKEQEGETPEGETPEGEMPEGEMEEAGE
jgi:NADH-quinone oxidoreductase subunit C